MANAAIGYSDFYKKNSNTPDSSEDDLILGSLAQSQPMSAEDKRKAAIRRRLMKQKKVGS